VVLLVINCLIIVKVNKAQFTQNVCLLFATMEAKRPVTVDVNVLPHGQVMIVPFVP
jgi:hypothetical protein